MEVIRIVFGKIPLPENIRLKRIDDKSGMHTFLPNFHNEL
jgi:hypothetical protein